MASKIYRNGVAYGGGAASPNAVLQIKVGDERYTPVDGVADLSDTIPKTYSLEILDSDWNNGTATVSVVSSKIKRYNYNVLKIDNNDVDDWMEFGVKGVSTTVTSVDGVAVLNTITFECDPNNVPDVDLSFNIVSHTHTGDNLTPLFFEDYGYADSELDSDSVYPVQNKVIKSALDSKVNTEQGKGLSTNDYTDADKVLVQDSPITVTATGAEITASTAAGKPQKITIYGKSEVVDNDIHSVGEGWATVDLGTLTWTYQTSHLSLTPHFSTNDIQTDITKPKDWYTNINNRVCALYRSEKSWGTAFSYPNNDMYICVGKNGEIGISNFAYTDPSAFKTAMSGVLLCYELANPTQGNCIAVKTDNGSGIDGTMWTFETGTPLRGIPDTTVRDSAVCDGQTGTVTKVCGVLNMGGLTWNKSDNGRMYSNPITGIKRPADRNTLPNIVNPIYTPDTDYNVGNLTTDKTIAIGNDYRIYVYDTDYTDATAFKTAMSGVKLVCELATPTTTPFTAAEIEQFNGLRTYDPTTAVSINDNPDFEVKAYAGTANGRAISEMSQEVQTEISALKITQSSTLTLTVNGWSSNQQTVTYAHNTAKRNVIDVDPASIKEWASCGVYAISETATGITFKCSTVPENALNFKVTSMGV